MNRMSQRHGSRRSKAAALVVAITGGLVPTVFTLTSAQASTGTVSGSVFRDVNGNGVQDAGEPMAGEVWVKAFGQQFGTDGVANTHDDAETAYGPVKTSAVGTWSITGVNSDSQVRVEFYGVDTNGDALMQSGEEMLN
jgi:hypothetical protein